MTTSAVSRGLTFGTGAESHERFRLGCPDDVVDHTLGYAGGDVATAVEVGAGTGKAARAFASRGVRVVALEADPDMLAVLRRETLGMQVHPVAATLEDYDGPRTGLVYAAESWQDIEPGSRLARAADLLVEGGTLAVFSSPIRLADPRLRAQVDRWRRSASEDEEAGTARELSGSGLFGDLQSYRLPRQVVRSQREFIGYLSTIRAYLDLPLDERQDLLRWIAASLPEQVSIDLSVHLHLARRTSDGAAR